MQYLKTAVDVLSVKKNNQIVFAKIIVKPISQLKDKWLPISLQMSLYQNVHDNSLEKEKSNPLVNSSNVDELHLNVWCSHFVSFQQSTIWIHRSHGFSYYTISVPLSAFPRVAARLHNIKLFLLRIPSQFHFSKSNVERKENSCSMIVSSI